MSPARVLFTDDGENILSAADTRTLQTTRQALYLSFSGMSPALLDAHTRDHSSDAEIHSLLQQTDRTLAGSPMIDDRVKVRRLLKDRLAPIILRLQNDPAASGDMLNGYERIIVIDDNAHPIFNDSAITNYLVISQSYERGGVRIYVCHAR